MRMIPFMVLLWLFTLSSFSNSAFNITPNNFNLNAGTIITIPPRQSSGQLAGFTHSSNVIIKPATPFANYVIKLNLNSTFNYESCAANGNDVRFFDAGNNSLSYWIETWNIRGNSTLWIRVLAASTASIKMVYGNQYALSMSNGELTFPFFDDFSGATINSLKWTIETDTYSTATISSGVAQLHSLPQNPTKMISMLGFSDMTVNHYATGGTVYNNGITRENEYVDAVKNYVSSYAISPACDAWLTLDYQWLNSTLARFSENGSLLLTTSTNIPTMTLPVLFAARGIEYGPGTHFAAILRSNVKFSPGQEIEARAFSQYDYGSGYPCLEAIVNVDWVFVRNASTTECAAVLGNMSRNSRTVCEDFESYTPTPIQWNDGSHGTNNRWTINTASNALSYTILSTSNSQQLDIKKVASNTASNPTCTYTFPVASGIPSGTNQPEVSFDFTIVNFPAGSWAWVGSITGGNAWVDVVFDRASNTFRSGRTVSGVDIWTSLVFTPRNAGGPALVFTPGVRYTVVVKMLNSSTAMLYVTDQNTGRAYQSQSTTIAIPFTTTGVETISFAPHRIYGYVGMEFMIDNIDLQGFAQPPIITSPPAIKITSPCNGSIFPSATVPLNVHVTGTTLDKTWYRLDGGAPVMLPSNTSIVVPDGIHVVQVFANNTAGQVSSSATSFIVDTAPPVMVINVPAENAVFSSSTINVSFSATDLTKNRTWYTIDGGSAIYLNQTTFTLDLANGTHVISISCDDHFGRTSTSTVHVIITLPVAPPAIQAPSVMITTPANGSIIPSDSVLMGARATGTNVTAFWCMLDDEAPVIIASSTTGTPVMSTTLSFTLPNGWHAIRFFANDSASLVGSAGIVFMINKTAPAPRPVILTWHDAVHGLWLNLTLASNASVIFVPRNISRSDPFFAALPDRLLPATPWYYNVSLSLPGSLIRGIGRIYYVQKDIASEVYEKDMVVVRWDAAANAWVSTGSILHKSQNYVEFDYVPNSMYILASTPKKNYDIVGNMNGIMLAGLCCVAAGIVLTESYKTHKKRTSLAMMAGILSKQESIELFLRDTPSSFHAREIPPELLLDVEPDIHVDATRLASIENNQATFNGPHARCLVHKGDVVGSKYTCPVCGEVYCLDCARMLFETNEPCWKCLASIDLAQGS